MRTLKNRAGLLVLVAGVVTLLAAGNVGADPSSRRLAGTWDLVLDFSGPGCELGCIIVDFRGAINGPGEGATSSPPAPANPPTNLISQGDLTVHTFRGDLEMEGTVIFNPAGDGEFAFLFSIVGGTGIYEGASGWIGSVGEAEVPGAQLTRQRYEGRLHLA